MADERPWHQNFIQYVEFIVKHPNYNWLFYERKDDWQVKWVVAWKSPNWLRRRAWWDQKCREYWIPIEAWCYAKIALKIHPTKKHTCQICWKELSIEYVYPTKNLLNKLDKLCGFTCSPADYTINEIIDYLWNDNNKTKLCSIFWKFFDDKEKLKKHVYDNFTVPWSALLSPGVMSNSPDRFDWFHSDWLCCRSESDKWRHKDNLSRYWEDRRVFENWTEWNWKMADRLMKYFPKHGISADHIWPISLWFCHRPKFQPLTRKENSSKNNRMSYKDVQTLLTDEKNWEKVVSRHSKYIWDSLKNEVKSDIDAVKLSKLMGINLHYVLTLFSMISEKWYDDFLKWFLRPDYSFFDYKFEWFSPKDGTFKRIIQKRKLGKDQKDAAERYIRKSFEALEKYKEKDNRKKTKWKDKEIDNLFDSLIDYLKENDIIKAQEILHDILKRFAKNLSSLRNAS